MFLIGSLTLEASYIYAKCLSEKCKISKPINRINFQNEYFKDNQISKSSRNFYKTNISEKKHTLENILQKESFKLDQLLSTLLVSGEEIVNNKNKKFSFEIESDSQYYEGNIFYAEGNVKVFLPNGILTADKISYDRNKKIFKAYSKLNFEKGNQFFKADYLEYNFINNKGHINNIFGILDLKTIYRDLKLYDYLVKENNCNKSNLDLNELPTEVDLLGSDNERYKNSIGSNKIKFNFSEVSNWRFKSERIDLKKNKWEAEFIEFTNDPYNNPQLLIKSKKFVGEIKDSKTKLSSKSTSINFDDKITVPIIGRRTISSNNDNPFRWGIGYETEDKDGVYLSRSFDPIELNKYFSLDMQSQLFIQRAIEGNSNAFRAKQSSVLSDNVKKEINFYDFFGFNSKLTGALFDGRLDVNLQSKTLNPDNFYDSFSGDLSFVRNLFNFQPRNNELIEDYCIKPNSLVNNNENYSLDLGFYSVFDQGDIYTSNGAKLLSTYKFISKNLNKDYSLVLDYGKYKGRSLVDKYKLENLDRYGVSSTFSHRYKVSTSTKKLISENNNYKPLPIEKGLFINAKIGSGFFEYSNGESQSILSFMMGPSYVFGSLENKFLDYTKISIFPEFIIKNGQSPFSFDDFNNDSRIKFDIKQQIFGPLIFGLQANLNINTDSSKYGNLENKKVSIELSRRAYSLGLSYLEDDNSVLFGFEIFNFGRSNFNNQF